MPVTYWLPLTKIRGPVPVEQIHAAFSRWFDDDHYANDKPYRLAPLSLVDGRWGLEISIFDKGEQLHLAVERRASERESVRLGHLATHVGEPLLVRRESWADLVSRGRESSWHVEFVTPFTCRTTSRSSNQRRTRSSPFPSPWVALRAAEAAWDEFSPLPRVTVARALRSELWVSDIDIHTTTYILEEHPHPGALGSITYSAADRVLARQVSPLFRLANYCGMGSFRGKGMGVVSVKTV